MSDRKSSIEVEVIDGTKLCEEIKTLLPGLPPEGTVKLDAEYCVVRTPKGTFLFDSEGCGGAKSVETKPSEIGITRGDVMLAGRQWRLPINKGNVGGLPIREKKNLADFIRRFGSRLDSNFDEWNRFLTKAMQV